MNTKHPTTSNPATATTNGNITPAQLLTYEKEYLIEEIRHQLKNMGHLFSVSLSHPVDDDDKEALMYLAWEKTENAKTLLHKLEQLIQEPPTHAGSNAKSNEQGNATVTQNATDGNGGNEQYHNTATQNVTQSNVTSNAIVADSNTKSNTPSNGGNA